MLSFTNNFPENFNWVRLRLLFCKVLPFERTRCSCLNFMIPWSFFLMWWQACRSSGSTHIPVSDGTGLISRVSYRASKIRSQGTRFFMHPITCLHTWSCTSLVYLEPINQTTLHQLCLKAVSMVGHSQCLLV